jgi:hypothetical protein
MGEGRSNLTNTVIIVQNTTLQDYKYRENTTTGLPSSSQKTRQLNMHVGIHSPVYPCQICVPVPSQDLDC